MFLDKEYFDGWMQRLSERLERIEKLCATGFTRHTPLLYDHSHKSYIILLSKIITAGKKTRSFLIRYHLPR